jgi:addiction module RelE/StbE family toxin
VTLRWTRLAIKDLDSAHTYVAEDNPSAANHLIDRIEKAVQVLRQHPTAGRKGRLTGTRELVVTGTPFVIPYRVRSNKIEILAVIHGASKWPDNL